MSVFKSMPIFKKKHWRVVRVNVLMDTNQMNVYAFDTACALLDKSLVSKVYFARYGDPHAGTTYVEFKVAPLVPDEELETFLRDYGPEIHTIETKPFDGSDAHAQAFLMARLLRGQGDEQIADVVHWLLNMTGYGYMDEVKLHSRSSYQIADTMNKMERGG